MFTEVKNKSQINLVEALAREIWTEHYTPIIGIDQVNYMLDKYQSGDAISDQIRNEGYLYYLIQGCGSAIGYIGIQFKESELFLSKLYVRSSERNKGFGKKAVQFLEQLAGEENINKISLTVNKNNTNTIKAYEKIGFEKSDSIVQDIGAGFVMDDYKMVKTFRNS